MLVHPLKVAIAADGRPAYQICAAAGINPNSVSRYIHGRSTPTLAVKLRLAAVLGRTVTDLFPADVTAEAIAASRAAETRRAQGLPPTITDTNVLDQIAEHVDLPAEGRAGRDRRKVA